MSVQESTVATALYDPHATVVTARSRIWGAAIKGEFWRKLALPIAILVSWELAARSGVLPAYNFPPPSAVANTLYQLLRSGTAFSHIAVSGLRVLFGFLIGTGAGTLLGALTGFADKWRDVFDGTVQSLRSVPIIAWVPLFILWLGIDEAPKLSLIALGAFFPVYLNLHTALRGVDRKLIEVGRANRMTGWRLVRSVMLPSALPAYVVGLRTGLGLSWMFVAAAELLGASSGIGYLLLEAQNLGRPAVVIASIVLFGLCGKITDAALAAAASHLLRWQDTATAER
jgi:sulfonate transport system permease protein